MCVGVCSFGEWETEDHQRSLIAVFPPQELKPGESWKALNPEASPEHFKSQKKKEKKKKGQQVPFFSVGFGQFVV